MYLLFFIISFGASIIGAICGIGGGVIIKPVLDASGTLLPGTINFLSGCTVLAMTCYSVLRNRLSGATSIEGATAVPLAVGATVGGLAGKQLFDLVEGLFATPDLAGAVQAVALGIITLGTLAYNSTRTRSPRATSPEPWPVWSSASRSASCRRFWASAAAPSTWWCSTTSSPWAPSRRRRTRSSSSCARRRRAPRRACPPWISALSTASSSPAWICCGIAGGIFGRIINKHIDEKHVDKLFSGLMVVIVLICVYNAAKHLVL